MDSNEVDIEEEVPIGTQDGEGVEEWRSDFPLPSEALRRIDSRRWLVLPERYCFAPLPAMDAAREADRLVAGHGGRALLKLALSLRRQRDAIAAIIGEQYEGASAEIVEEAVDLRMAEVAEVALEEFLGDVEGKSFSPVEWSLSWIQRCAVRRVPLPASQDVGGLVATAKGPAAWAEFYRGRYVVLFRLAAAVAWESLGPFFLDVRPNR